MKLLGIAGTNGAGKDSVAEYLVAKHGWFFVSVSELLRDEARARGLPPDRHTTHDIGTEWRRQHGMGVLIDKAVEKYGHDGGDGEFAGLVIASLRHPGEADEVHRLGGKVIWLDADSRIRYQRATSRGRGPDDQKTFEEFLTEEQHQMNHSGDAATLSMEGVKAKADIFIENSGNDIDKFQKTLAKVLSL